MASMTSDWDEFSKQVKAHITESGKKYKLAEGVELANLLTWEWALGDGAKYIIEICRWIGQGVIDKFSNPREVMRLNILKAVHCLQIAYTKLGQVPEEEKPKPDPPKPDYYGPPEPLQ